MVAASEIESRIIVSDFWLLSAAIVTAALGCAEGSCLTRSAENESAELRETN